MEGTSNPMTQVVTQIAMFSKLCNAQELSHEGPGRSRSGTYAQPGHYKVCFAGCGVTNGIPGVVFASGLRGQCQVVRQHLEAFLGNDLTLVLNFVGLSRGGIGGVYLAQELADMDPERVRLNMLLFDPVPGNFITISRYLDVMSWSNANLSMEIQSCPILERVLVLYPYEPLPWFAVHAPVLIKFPEGVTVEEDVILGCHQGALFLHPATDTRLSFALIRDFLLELGSRLDLGRAGRLNTSDSELASILTAELGRVSPQTRDAHCPGGGATIVRQKAGRFLNRAHEKLLRKLGQQPSAGAGGNTPTYMLDFEGRPS